jgi:hypothetical protein
MRLTTELIKDSLSYLNPLKERELDLRGAFLKRTDATPPYLARAELISGLDRGARAYRTPNPGD